MRRPQRIRRGLRQPTGGRGKTGSTSPCHPDPIYGDALRLAAGRCQPWH